MSDKYKSTEIDLLRHGQCQGGHIFRGSTDVLLSESGLQQMQASVELLDTTWDRVVSSPRSRCKLFAHQFSLHHSLPIEVETRLEEVDFGEWDGEQCDRVWTEDHTRVSAWFNDPVSNAPPGGESTLDFSERVIDGYFDLLNRYKGEKLLLITHGGVIRMILSHILGMPVRNASRFQVAPASISRLQITHTPDGNFTQLLSHAGMQMERAA